MAETYTQWKKLVPYLYDWFTNHNLTWPSLSCRWGPVVSETEHRRLQRVYLSEQTDGSEPNKLVVATADICKPRVAAAEHVAAWSESARSPHISGPVTTILHPGEVNKLREMPARPSIVVTHTDAPELYVWDLDAQPDRTAEEKEKGPHAPSVATLVLEGHTDDAEYALGMCSAQPLVASGGKDTQVLVWNLQDHVSSLGAGPSSSHGAPSLLAQTRLEGHSATVEDVVFCPGSATELASVGDDSALLLWDTRAGGAPVLAVPEAHGAIDVHCVDWSGLRAECVVTGAADGTVKVWDRRRPDGAVHSFHHHSAAAMHVEWSPHRAGVFASGGEDRLICVWDLDARGQDADGPAAAKRQKSALPPQLVFQHAGHRAPVVDFQWNPSDPWTLLSVSDDVSEGGGGTVQLWRVSDLVYRPEDEVLQELEQYRDFILTGQESKLAGREGGAEAAPAPAAAATAPAADAAPAADPVAAPAEEPKPEVLVGEAGPVEGAAPPSAPS